MLNICIETPILYLNDDNISSYSLIIKISRERKRGSISRAKGYLTIYWEKGREVQKGMVGISGLDILCLK